MIDRAQAPEPGKVTAVPGPPGARPRPGAAQRQTPGTCRATVRNALDTALRGIVLGGRDRQFSAGWSTGTSGTPPPDSGSLVSRLYRPVP
jgi:hypothetical protein